MRRCGIKRWSFVVCLYCAEVSKYSYSNISLPSCSKASLAKEDDVCTCAIRIAQCQPGVFTVQPAHQENYWDELLASQEVDLQAIKVYDYQRLGAGGEKEANEINITWRSYKVWLNISIFGTGGSIHFLRHSCFSLCSCSMNPDLVSFNEIAAVLCSHLCLNPATLQALSFCCFHVCSLMANSAHGSI